MNQDFSYTTAFMLDRAHYGECFDQSVVIDHSVKPYYKAIGLFVFGLILLFAVGSNNYAAFFVVALGVLEASSVYYRRTWWLWRQMLSKASNSKVTLVIDQVGITTESFHVNNKIAWPDVTSVEQTEQGILVRHTSGVNYISASCLNDQAIEFIIEHQPND